MSHRGAAALNDHVYDLSEQGREFAQHAHNYCSYCGPAPVPLGDYVTSVDAQTISAECPRRADLEQAFGGISVNPAMFARLGPAINSGAGCILYCGPGIGKTTTSAMST